MNLDPAISVIFCVDASESLKRHEQFIGGQLWLQEDRKITATNLIFLGMPNDANSTALVAIAEAVEWKHAFEPSSEKRQRQCVVIYPPTSDKLEEVLATGDSNRDPEAGHDMACQRIFEACASFEQLPRFYSSSSPELLASEVGSKVAEWMHTAKQVSVGGRKQVLEDGNDVCDSESDSENEDHGEVLSGMYTSKIPVDKEGNPLSAAYKLSPEQVAAQRWGPSTSCVFTGSTIQPSTADPGMSTTHSLPTREADSVEFR
jgi:hypothetical protein